MPTSLERHSIRVLGSERTYWVAPAIGQPAPLLLVFHGSGLSGPLMAAWTGLAERGPAAGFATVFPDGCQEMWDDAGRGRTDGIDDAAFVAELVDRLVADRTAQSGETVLVGLSNGACFAERLARYGVIAAAGLVLVAGTAREASRRQMVRPPGGTQVLCFEGTADQLSPYRGGYGKGPMAWMARRCTRPVLIGSGRREVVAAELLAADWAAANGYTGAPLVEPELGEVGDLTVDRLTWAGPGGARVVLYRIKG
ncbi:MAG: hypothetical protein WA751_04140 [Candidatus Dormiibacterota bacterium]